MTNLKMYSKITRQILLAVIAQLLLLTLSSNHGTITHVIAQVHHNFREGSLPNTLVEDPIPDIPDEDSPRCEPMQISFCNNVYNQTMLPNVFGHKNQAEVDSDVNIFEPLVKVNCFADLRLFLCAVYAPICFNHGHEVTLGLQPCQSLCESARSGCAGPLRQLGIPWPVPLECHKFPDGRQGGPLCVGNDSSIDTKDSPREVPLRDLGFVCPRNFEVESYSFHLNGKKYNNCAMPCEGVYLDQHDTRSVRIAVGILASVCFVSTVFTCLTFLIDTKRFEYPARPIIMIAFCQMVVATCYLIGLSTSNKIACNDPLNPPKSLPNMKMIRSTTMGNKKGSCTLLFMTLYFFQLSTVMWWLMMTISWYMIAKLKWAPEAVSSVARYFHFSSWAIPALLTILLTVLGDIEGDSVSGTCFISVTNEESMMTFLIIPVILCLSLGCVFLATGFKSIWETREMLRQKYSNQTDEHIKLVTRIGLYSLLFILFALAFVCSHYYELSNQTIWKMAWLSNVCKIRDYSIPCPIKNYSPFGPHYFAFIIKYAATMATGMISALFMMSQKTVNAYREATAMYDHRLRSN